MTELIGLQGNGFHKPYKKIRTVSEVCLYGL